MGFSFLEMTGCLNETVSRKELKGSCLFFLKYINLLIKLETKIVNWPSKLIRDNLTFCGYSSCLTARIKELCGFSFGLLFLITV